MAMSDVNPGAGVEHVTIEDRVLSLLSEANRNSGRLELRWLFGNAAKQMTTLKQIIPAVQGHPILQWCRELDYIVFKCDESLQPPVWFEITGHGKDYVDRAKKAGRL